VEIDMSDDERARIIRCDDLLEADVNGEIVALHIEKGQCYGMNGVASRVWALLAEPTTPEQICAKLSGEYEVELETCRADVMALLDDLRKEGLIKPAGQ
jgi:hypothetical protein